MNVNGEYRIPAPREAVFAALRDPETLRACIPGCEELRLVEDGVYEGRLTTQVGAVTTAFEGRLRLVGGNPPAAWEMEAEMRSPSAGWAEGQASVSLVAEAEGTVLSYRARVEPGGRLASVGSRLLHGVAIRLANDFFTRLIERLRPHPLRAEPVDLAEPGGKPPRRRVEPLAPTSAPGEQGIAVHVNPPRESDAVPGLAYQGEVNPRTRATIIIAGLIIWVAILAVLFWPRA